MTAAVDHVSGYLPVSRRALDLEDYIDIARRHSAWIAGPLLAGTVIATVVAFIMPNVYVSQAEMQITPAQVSESIVKTTINQRLNERIIQMEQEILSRTSLSQIIQDPGSISIRSERAKEPLEDVIEKMRTQDVKIKIESTPGEFPEIPTARRRSSFRSPIPTASRPGIPCRRWSPNSPTPTRSRRPRSRPWSRTSARRACEVESQTRSAERTTDPVPPPERR